MKKSCLLALMIPFAMACGDDGLGGKELSLNSLNGTYAAGDDCSVRVAESQVMVANCQSGELTVTGTGTLSDSSVSATGTATGSNELFEDCYGRATCTTSVAGSASKSQNRSEDGPFSSFAGAWSGSVTFERNCFESEPAMPLPEYCGEPLDETSTAAYTFDIDIFGRAANLVYRGEETGEATIVGTENAIEVDGERFEKL